MSLNTLNNDDPGFPEGVKGIVSTSLIEDAPESLYIIGDTNLVTNAWDRGVTVIGSRASTPYGELITRKVVQSLEGKSRSLVVPFGRGIAQIAVATALGAGIPVVAIVAHGIEREVPEDQQRRLDLIVENGGAVVSELGEDEGATRSSLVRSGIIATALSPVTILVKGSARGNSILYGRAAIEMGRMVGAIPHPFTGGTREAPAFRRGEG